MDIQRDVEALKAEIDQKKKVASLLTAKITVRKMEVEALGYSSKMSNTPDTQLRQMQEKAAALNAELHQLKVKYKALKALVPEPPQAPKPKPTCSRNVVLGEEFRDCSAYERKLALLMVNEIGQKRYEELRRQAKASETTVTVARYETVSAPRSVTYRVSETDDFEKMMRRNFNSYAGREI